VTLPVAKVEVAFGTAPLTAPGAWTDITIYCRSISIRRGRDHELSQSQAGECTIRLTNTDRRFDPLYTSGAYYPNVIPMRQIRITATHNAVTYPLFYGYVEDWSQTWPGRPISAVGDAECVLHAVDGFKLLSLYQLRNTYSAEVLADEPVAYWQLVEPVGSALYLDSSGGGNDLTPGTTAGITMGVTPGPLIGGSSVLDCDGSAAGTTAAFTPLINNPGLGTPLFLSNPVVECWVKLDTGPTAGWVITGYRDSAGTRAAELAVADGSGHLSLKFFAVSEQAHTTVTLTLGTGAWTHVVAVKNSFDCDWYKNGVFVERTTLGSASHSLFIADTEFSVAGVHNLGNTSPDGKIAHVAYYRQGGALAGGAAAAPFKPGRIAAHYAALNGSIGATDAGAQTTLLLDMMGWPAGLRTIDTGASQMQSFDPTGTALGHLLAIAEDSEAGLVQMSADGKVTFHSRTSLLASTGSHGASQATFGDAGAELPYEDVEFRYDDQDLWTRVIVTRDQGTSQLKEDATALAAYGPRTLDRSAPRLTTDADSQLLATFLLDSYRAPKVRPLSVGLQLGSDNTLNAAALGRETHHDRVTVVRRPQGGGSAISFEAHVEGINWEIDPVGPWGCTLALVPEPGVRFIFDECLIAPGTLDGGVTETNSGAGADVTLHATAYAGHPGILELATGTTTTGRSGLLGTADAVQLGALDVLYQSYCYLPILSTAGETFTIRLGLGDSVAAESVDYVGFRYSHGVNAGEWEGVCRSNSVETARDTNVLVVAATWVKLGFTVNTAGTSVQFYIDDVAVGAAVTTNIPTGASRLLTYLPAFVLKSAGTTSRSLLLDRYGFVMGP